MSRATRLVCALALASSLLACSGERPFPGATSGRPTLAYITVDGVRVAADSNQSSKIVDARPGEAFQSLSWSRDARFLAFLARTDEISRVLRFDRERGRLDELWRGREPTLHRVAAVDGTVLAQSEDGHLFTIRKADRPERLSGVGPGFEMFGVSGTAVIGGRASAGAARSGGPSELLRVTRHGRIETLGVDGQHEAEGDVRNLPTGPGDVTKAVVVYATGASAGGCSRYEFLVQRDLERNSTRALHLPSGPTTESWAVLSVDVAANGEIVVAAVSLSDECRSGVAVPTLFVHRNGLWERLADSVRWGEQSADSRLAMLRSELVLTEGIPAMSPPAELVVTTAGHETVWADDVVEATWSPQVRESTGGT